MVKPFDSVCQYVFDCHFGIHPVDKVRILNGLKRGKINEKQVVIICLHPVFFPAFYH